MRVRVLPCVSDTNSQPSIEWEQFKAEATYHLRANEADLDNLQGVLGNNTYFYITNNQLTLLFCVLSGGELGVLDKGHFTKFLRWFSPLVPESDTISTRAPSSVWKISTVCLPRFLSFNCFFRSSLFARPLFGAHLFLGDQH